MTERSHIIVLDNCDSNFTTPLFNDAISLLDSGGEVIRRIGGLNICQNVGGNRAISVSGDSHSVQECRLRNVTVSSIRTAGGAKSRSRTGDTVTLSYESIEWTYVKIDSATGRVTSAAAAQWDLPAKEGQQNNR